MEKGYRKIDGRGEYGRGEEGREARRGGERGEEGRGEMIEERREFIYDIVCYNSGY